MTCPRCLNRREFLATTAGAGLLVLGCGDGDVTGTAPRFPITPGVPGSPNKLMVQVADFAQLANVGVLVALGNSGVAAKRTGTNTFDAFSMVCTHQGCLTAIVNGQRFDCPCHGSRFASDGSVLNGPFTGETIQPLAKLATTYDASTDTLTIG